VWREVMLLAHEGLPPMTLPGTMPASPLAMGSMGSEPVGLTPRQ
jgi:hypothetical protein